MALVFTASTTRTLLSAVAPFAPLPGGYITFPVVEPRAPIAALPPLAAVPEYEEIELHALGSRRAWSEGEYGNPRWFTRSRAMAHRTPCTRSGREAGRQRQRHPDHARRRRHRLRAPPPRPVRPALAHALARREARPRLGGAADARCR